MKMFDHNHQPEIICIENELIRSTVYTVSSTILHMIFGVSNIPGKLKLLLSLF
jgi:hypothetical protein